MRFKALNNFTDRLPLLSIENDFESFVGKTTQESILSGVQNGVLQELKGVIKQYKLQFPGIKVILTGGDWQFFENALKNSIFAAPFLILEGLNEILNFNVENKKIIHYFCSLFYAFAFGSMRKLHLKHLIHFRDTVLES